MIKPVNATTVNFNGRLRKGFLSQNMMKNFSESELLEYKGLISKLENTPDGRVFSLLRGRKIDSCDGRDYHDFYQFVEMNPETADTFLPLSYCVKEVLSEKTFLSQKGYKTQTFPKACVDVILEPLRKIYGGK